MACEHKHIKCVNCEFICADCGAKIEQVPGIKRVTSDEKPKRRTKKGATKE